MRHMKNLSIPNILTLIRIFVSLSLLFIPVYGPAFILFILLYLLCGLTDILDGYIARRTNKATALGARLDSMADCCMCLMILVTLFRQHQLTKPLILIIVCITVLRFINFGISWAKFKSPSSIHTIANKLTGLFLFFSPISYALWGNTILFITGVLAFLSSVEESLIFLTSETIDLNRKSIFTKWFLEIF